MPYIPPAMNLGQFPVMIPSIMFREPREGRGSITFNIDWSEPIAKGLEAVNINLQNSATLEFSQICGLVIDNSNCGADLDFIFPDTDVTVSIPAYAPYTVLQVNTQQVQFFVRGLGIINGDVTHFSVLNYAPDPIAVPITIQQLTASVGSIAIDGAAVTPIIPAGVNGSIRGFNVNAAVNTAAGAYNDLFTLSDGAGMVIWQGNLAGPAGAQSVNGPLVDLSNLNVRFENGIYMTQTGGFVVGGTIDVNLFYRVP